jgi:pyruvate dehydrogenase E2 component (dihydrolipoamide acetyltransferase)
MATEIKLPRLGQGMESGTIVKWLKSEGERVEKGEPLYELDTDKVTQEVEADASGVLLKIAIAEGEVEVGKTVAVIGEEGETPSISDDGGQNGDGAPASAEKPARAPARDAERERGREASADAQADARDAQTEAQLDTQATQPAAADEPTQGDGRVSGSEPQTRIKASPLARRIARERGIDLAQLSGTGPEGRIVAEDVERAETARPAELVAQSHKVAPPGEIELVPLTNVRKTIARRLTEAWTIPVFQLTADADMSRALTLREQLVERAGERPKPTVTDLLTKIAAVALMQNRAVNAHFAEDGIRRFPTADIGLAVAAPQGLVVPVIKRAESLSVLEIAAARADVVSRARDNKLRREDLEGGTFTISNLGMFGVDQFIAVLNPPQAAIVAVGATIEKPVARDGEIVSRPMLTLTLTCDHRAIDGADGAKFLADLKAFLEEPGLAL